MIKLVAKILLVRLRYSTVRLRHSTALPLNRRGVAVTSKF